MAFRRASSLASSVASACRRFSTGGHVPHDHQAAPHAERRSPALFLSFAVVSGTVGYGFWRIINDPEYTASHKSAPTPEEVAAKAAAAVAVVERETRLTPEKIRHCFMDVSIAGTPAGRMVFALRWDAAPKTCENFRSLCVGDNPKALSFKTSRFHRIIPGFMVQGGDITRGDGTGGMSIYGRTFDDESFALAHDRPGLLSMANSGRNTNSSQFFITLAPFPHLNNKHVVFGELVEGEDVLAKVAAQGTGKGHPRQLVEVTACDQLPATRTIDAKA